MINPKEESYGRSNRNNIRKRWSRKNNNNSKFRASLAVEGKKSSINRHRHRVKKPRCSNGVRKQNSI